MQKKISKETIKKVVKKCFPEPIMDIRPYVKGHINTIYEPGLAPEHDVIAAAAGQDDDENSQYDEGDFAFYFHGFCLPAESVKPVGLFCPARARL